MAFKNGIPGPPVRLSHHNSDYKIDNDTDSDFQNCYDDHAADKPMKYNAGILPLLPNAILVLFHNTAGHQRFREGESAYFFRQSYTSTWNPN